MEVIKILDIRISKNGKYRQRWALFVCPHCDTEVEKPLYTGKRNQSCGCAHVELVARCNRKHGETGSPLYRTWRNIKTRCYWPKHECFKNYGGKGITVCPEWKHDFLAFKVWAESNGYEEGLSIDRIDPSKGYSPVNCQWLPLGENAAKDKIGKPGHKWTEAERMAVSIQRKGRKYPNRKRSHQTPEHTEKIRQAQLKSWAKRKGELSI